MASSHEADKPPPTLYSIAKSLAAGGLAGGVYVFPCPCLYIFLRESLTEAQEPSWSCTCRSRTAVAPLERLKILMQVQGNDKVYTGMWQVWCLGRLWTCNSPNSALRNAAELPYWMDSSQWANTSYNFLYLFLKWNRLRLVLHLNQSVVQGFKHMTQAGGLREWFKGNGTNCIRIIPNSAVKFVTYEQLTRYAMKLLWTCRFLCVQCPQCCMPWTICSSYYHPETYRCAQVAQDAALNALFLGASSLAVGACTHSSLATYVQWSLWYRGCSRICWCQDCLHSSFLAVCMRRYSWPLGC